MDSDHRLSDLYRKNMYRMFSVGISLDIIGVIVFSLNLFVFPYYNFPESTTTFPESNQSTTDFPKSILFISLCLEIVYFITDLFFLRIIRYRIEWLKSNRDFQSFLKAIADYGGFEILYAISLYAKWAPRIVCVIAIMLFFGGNSIVSDYVFIQFTLIHVVKIIFQACVRCAAIEMINEARHVPGVAIERVPV